MYDNHSYPAGADAELRRLEEQEKDREQFEEYVCSSAWVINNLAGIDLAEDDWAKLQEEGFITDADITRLADLAEGKGITP